MLLVGLAVLLAAGWVGDDALTPAGRTAFEDHGPAVLGLVTAVAVAIGLRSGSRGGPLAVEDPDIAHVLLGPVEWRTALRPLAVRQLRFLLFASILVGLVGGHLAARRLDGQSVAWMAAVATWAVTTMAAAVGAAWLAAGVRLRPWIATGVGALIVAWSLWDLASDGPSAPTTIVGGWALWPLESDWRALGASGVVVALCVAGVSQLGGVSLERMRHRSALIGQLRFAATMRDIRTVMVLRRQLSHERPRRRPWLTLRRLPGLPPIVRRDIRALMRSPATRLARMGALGVVAAIAAAGVWRGTTPLVLVAGVASFLAGLEAVEPLAQEIDHPVVHELLPTPRGRLFAQHLTVPAATMIVVGGFGLLAVVIAGADRTEGAVAAITVVPAALAATAGAAVSTVKSQIDPGADADADASLAMQPEITGMRLLYETALPPAIAAIGFAPVVAARKAVLNGLDPVDRATSAVVPVLLAAAAAVAWIRYRDEIKAWHRRTVEEASAQRRSATSGTR